MKSTIASISALLLSVAILLTGDGLQSTLLPVRAQIEAFTSFERGKGLFGFSAVVHAAMAGFAINRIRLQAPVPEEDRTPYVGSIVTPQA